MHEAADCSGRSNMATWGTPRSPHARSQLFALALPHRSCRTATRILDVMCNGHAGCTYALQLRPRHRHVAFLFAAHRHAQLLCCVCFTQSHVCYMHKCVAHVRESARQRGCVSSRSCVTSGCREGFMGARLCTCAPLATPPWLCPCWPPLAQPLTSLLSCSFDCCCSA